MGEFKVHRVRFFDYMPSAIRAMAFNSRSERLAVARADGAVEVFNFADNYFQEKVTTFLQSRFPSHTVFILPSVYDFDYCCFIARCGTFKSLSHFNAPMQARKCLIFYMEFCITSC